MILSKENARQGDEFAGQMTDLWASTNKVALAFSRPGKPTDNAYIESLNGSFRDVCPNCHWFESLTDAKLKIEACWDDYNKSRPHRALNNLPPWQFVVFLHPNRLMSRDIDFKALIYEAHRRLHSK